MGLAWQAFGAGNIGIGAVLTDHSGAVVAEGRNRVCDGHGPPGRLRGTPLAHAEMDVLGQLGAGDYSRHTLWTTLEPCPLCSTAIVMSNVGHVRFAAGDRLWQDTPPMAGLNGFMAERWPRREGPLEGPVAVFCELLPVLWFVRNKPDGTVVRCYAESHPALLALTQRLADDSRLTALQSAPVAAVLNELWPELITG